MRIAMLADFPADPDRILGGVQAVSVYLARALARLDDVELHVVTADPTTATDSEMIHRGMTLHRIGTRSPLKSLPKLLTVDVRKLIGKARALAADVVHGQGADLYGFAAISSGRPAVVTLHGMLWEDARYWKTRRERLRGRVAAFVFERACIQRASNVISISPYVRDYWGTRLKATVYPIENPIDEAFFRLPADGSRSGSILYAGVLAPRKRVADLIEALAQVRATRLPITLRIAGQAVDARYSDELHALVRARNVEDAVSFLGNLDEERVLEEYARCSMLVLPSAQETAPMAIEQAMAAAKPVVATRVGGVPHLVAHGETGLVVEPGNVAGLAAAIARLAGQPAQASTMGSAARTQAFQRFHAGAVASRTRDVYHQVVGMRQAPSPWSERPASEMRRVQG